jgi:DNA-binding phage protein
MKNMSKTNRRSQPHDEVVAEMLRTDPEFRAVMTNGIMADGDVADLLIFLRQLVLADGGMNVSAERSGHNETALYRTITAQGNPSMKTFARLLESLNLRMIVVPKDTACALAA